MLEALEALIVIAIVGAVIVGAAWGAWRLKKTGRVGCACDSGRCGLDAGEEPDAESSTCRSCTMLGSAECMLGRERQGAGSDIEEEQKKKED